MSEKIKTVVITGPTATGKTALAVKLARLYPAEIVSVDSRQVYRGMDIGTGKDLDEYGLVPHHLIDIADPQSEVYHLARFVRDAYRAIRRSRRAAESRSSAAAPRSTSRRCSTVTACRAERCLRVKRESNGCVRIRTTSSRSSRPSSSTH